MTLVATHAEGFSVVLERNGSVIPGVYEPVMQLACLDASIAIKPVFDRFSSVREGAEGRPGRGVRRSSGGVPLLGWCRIGAVPKPRGRTPCLSPLFCATPMRLFPCR